jgi:serine protease Do
MSGMTWIFVGLLIFFIVGGIFSAVIKPIRDRVRVQIAQQSPRSFVGVNNFQTAEGNTGATFGNVSAPDTPADKAGLVGGDIITMLDSKPVNSRKEMMEILQGIPIGKTVDLVYLRDGESKETKLTTVSEEESDRLTEAFDDRAEGHGIFGFDNDDTERVAIPGTKMFGVKLGKLDPSLPAVMAGIKQGDIVIAFDKIPIRTTREFNSRVQRAIPYSTVDVTVIRDGEQLVIPVRMGKTS